MGGSDRGGGGAVMAVVRNAPGRATVARSSAWTRGGLLGLVRRRARERRRGERGGVDRLFEAEAARQGRGEVRLGAAWRARTEKEEGAPGAACDNAAARQRSIAARPQCRAVAPVHRRARAAQCRVA
jgi:hypothetical protein